MTDVTTTAKPSLKHYLWVFFGAMFMETKDGKQAISLTRIMTVILFASLMWKWGGYAATPDVPEYMMYTFWGLIGVNGTKSVTATIKSNGIGSSATATMAGGAPDPLATK